MRDYNITIPDSGVMTQTNQSIGIVDQLNFRKADLENQLAECNKALDALNRDPNLATTLNLVTKALQGRY